MPNVQNALKTVVTCNCVYCSRSIETQQLYSIQTYLCTVPYRCIVRLHISRVAIDES